jgi:iron-sulfur cluster assembly protein
MTIGENMIKLTESAYEKVKSQIQKHGKIGIRIGVKTTGCSGLAYTLEYVDKYKSEIGVINYTQKDFVVLVDAKSEVYLNGVIMDWVRNGLNEGFDFKNPNERDRCGCGESFRV